MIKEGVTMVFLVIEENYHHNQDLLYIYIYIYSLEL